MSHRSPSDYNRPDDDKENYRRATDLSSPLMVTAPKAHSTPLESPELSHVRRRAKECLQLVFGSAGDFRALSSEFCKNCLSSHPSAHETALLTLLETDRSSSPTKKMEQFIRHIQHAMDCKNLECYSATCGKAKRLLQHINSCVDCEVYSQLMGICCEHSKKCRGKGCSIVYCAMIRQLESPRTARKRLREEQKGAKTPSEKKTRKSKALKETPLTRTTKINQANLIKDVNEIESPGVTGAFKATMASPGFSEHELDGNRFTELQKSGRSDVEEGEIHSSDDEGSEISDCSDNEYKDDFYSIVDEQKELYHEIMESIACKEPKDIVDEKYHQFQQTTFDAFKAAEALSVDPYEMPKIRQMRGEVDNRFIKVSQLDWRQTTKPADDTEAAPVALEEESDMEHHESCRILNGTSVMEESQKADLIKTPLYEKTVKTVYRKVEKTENSRAVGGSRLSALLRAVPAKLLRGIVAILTNGMVILMVIAYFLHVINN